MRGTSLNRGTQGVLSEDVTWTLSNRQTERQGEENFSTGAMPEGSWQIQGPKRCHCGCSADSKRESGAR